MVSHCEGNKISAMGKDSRMGHSTRNLALRLVTIFLAGTLAGSLAPESGNILAYWLKMPYVQGHFFNPFFIAVGILGIGVAYCLGYRKGRRFSKVLVVSHVPKTATETQQEKTTNSSY